MKKLQYSFDMTYSNPEVIQNFGTLLKIVVSDVQELKKAKKRFSPKDFALYPINASKLARTRKVLLVSDSKRGEKILDAIDTKWMEEVQKSNLKVVREEIK